MFRLSKPVLAVLAGLVLTAATAAGAIAANSPSPSAANSPSSSASGAAGDPSGLLIQAVSNASSVKSFHFAATIDGSLKPADLMMDGGLMPTAAANVNLNGTTLQGDVDVPGHSASVSFTLPTLSTSGKLIAIDHVMYYQVGLIGPKYRVVDLSGLAALKSARPTPGPADMARLLSGLAIARQQFDAAGGKLTLAGVDQIAGQSADRVAVTVPVSFLNQKIAAHAAANGQTARVTVQSFSLDVWVYASSHELAQVALKASSSQGSDLDFTATFTSYNAPVTITAPSSDQIQIGNP